MYSNIYVRTNMLQILLQTHLHVVCIYRLHHFLKTRLPTYPPQMYGRLSVPFLSLRLLCKIPSCVDYTVSCCYAYMESDVHLPCMIHIYIHTWLWIGATYSWHHFCGTLARKLPLSCCHQKATTRSRMVQVAALPLEIVAVQVVP